MEIRSCSGAPGAKGRPRRGRGPRQCVRLPLFPFPCQPLHRSHRRVRPILKSGPRDCKCRSRARHRLRRAFRRGGRLLQVRPSRAHLEGDVDFVVSPGVFLWVSFVCGSFFSEGVSVADPRPSSEGRRPGWGPTLETLVLSSLAPDGCEVFALPTLGGQSRDGWRPTGGRDLCKGGRRTSTSSP